MTWENSIEFNHITKSFPGVKALADVSFSLKRGEIHALCGENGAGKSTLINICSGVITPNQGDLIINGQKVNFESPQDAEHCKIATVHQEVPVCGEMTIAENIFLGPKPKSRMGFIDRKFMNRETKNLLMIFNLPYRPTTLIKNISLPEQSLIQFLRAIYTDPDILILDEPTASLSNEKKNLLFSFLKEKRLEKEITVLYVSHKLEEIFEITDRISVLRDGEYIDTINTSEANLDSVINMMVGRAVEKHIYQKTETCNQIVFEARHLSRKHILKDINFDIKKGEILGFAGLQGAGRTEMARVIFGVDKADNGEFLINGQVTKIKNIGQAISKGIAMIPEDRRDAGIVPTMSVLNNLLMVALKKVSKFGFISKKKSNELIQKYTASFNIKYTNSKQLIAQLSGGNQQKVILSRWFANSPSLLICDEPTRGIDVNNKSEIHSILVDLAKKGMAVILISSELPDLLTICDRIIVMKEGRITGQVTHEEATEEKIMVLATA